MAYLKPWEVQQLHDLIDGKLENKLNTRDNAIAALLLFTGLRACDIAGLLLDAIDWNGDVIRTIQQKTGVPLELPLTAIIGNTLYDYITQDRPKSDDPHVFLRLRQPHYPLSAGGIKDISRKIYDAASIRMDVGDRRGTHLFSLPCSHRLARRRRVATCNQFDSWAPRRRSLSAVYIRRFSPFASVRTQHFAVPCC